MERRGRSGTAWWIAGPRLSLAAPRRATSSRRCASRASALSVMASTFRASPALPVPPEVHGELVIMLAVCYAGDLDAGERALQPLRSFGRPLADLIAPMP